MKHSAARNGSGRLWSLILLSLIGLVVSVMQSIQFYHLRSGSSSFKSYCNLGQQMNCDAVIASRYAELFAGIPLSSFAAGWMLALVFIFFLARSDEWRGAALRAAVLMTGFMVAVRTRRGRRAKDKMTLKLPVLGEVIRFSIVERFCRLLSTMMGAGVPLPEAMAVLGQGVKNVIFQERLADVRDAMMRGEGLARPMGASKLFPGAMIQMVRVGESTGTLDDQLEVASDYYGQELEYKIQHLTALFEPAIIIVMGLAVGFVAVALVSAMYGIYRQVQF